MSVFLILISILLFSCQESKKVKSNFTKNERIKVNDSLPLLKDFLLLEDELLQKDLFKKIDSGVFLNKWHSESILKYSAVRAKLTTYKSDILGFLLW